VPSDQRNELGRDLQRQARRRPEAAEALVRDVLAAAEDRTVLLITHRPEGPDLVDEVVRLDAPVGGEHARRPQGRALSR